MKRILRIVIIIIVFSFIYYIRFYLQHPEYGFNLFFFVKLIYSEPFITPYWFLYSYLTFLLILPFLRRLALASTDEEYLYLSILAWAAIFLNGCAGILMTYLYYIKTGIYDVIFIEKFNLLPAAAVFFIIKYSCDRLEQSVSGAEACAPCLQGTERAVLYVGSCTFCTYLFEEMLRIDLFIKLFAQLSPPLPTLLVCILYIFCMLVAGIAISTVLKRVPGMKWLGL